jgi:hypothetical protein
MKLRNKSSLLIPKCKVRNSWHYLFLMAVPVLLYVENVTYANYRNEIDMAVIRINMIYIK